ncbi:hypothetical protein NDU88_002296 [Pleurodeles waltl]|uniref:Uncharacterized protein n=1 Tax=Pleurodeles waltl TaxID=8319 RepID=A0AAV7W2W3_PLEWA|nr:hypothetical protein NDU88_002296 [Pleurodeles waltl]
MRGISAACAFERFVVVLERAEPAGDGGVLACAIIVRLLWIVALVWNIGCIPSFCLFLRYTIYPRNATPEHIINNEKVQTRMDVANLHGFRSHPWECGGLQHDRATPSSHAPCSALRNVCRLLGSDIAWARKASARNPGF